MRKPGSPTGWGGRGGGEQLPPPPPPAADTRVCRSKIPAFRNFSHPAAAFPRRAPKGARLDPLRLQTGPDTVRSATGEGREGEGGEHTSGRGERLRDGGERRGLRGGARPRRGEQPASHRPQPPAVAGAGRGAGEPGHRIYTTELPRLMTDCLYSKRLCSTNEKV